jgi:LysM repeat protein
MKMPKLPRIAFPRRPKKLHAATAAARRAPSDDYYDEEPKTNLSSAFIVVLILHVVAVGGIYTFNSIRAARRGPEVPATSSSADTASAGSPLAAKAGATTATPDLAKRDSTPAALKPGTYRVQAGDNLTKIALLHGLTVTDLEQANEIKNVNGISPGQILNIPAAKPAPKIPAVPDDPRKAAFLAAKVDGKPTVTTNNGNARTYTVVKNDTPTSIARKFGITSAELLKFNKIDDPKKMQLGQTLKVPPKKN